MLNGAKDTFFKSEFTLNLKGDLVTLDSPVVMGILNVTPDSFYDGGKHLHNVLNHAERMLKEGAWMLDIGGASTRPGSKQPTEDEELRRVLPAVEQLTMQFPEAYLSVDTYRSAVAKEAVEAGACLVNDVSAGSLDPALHQTVANLGVPYVLMHMQGTPQTMQQSPTYQNVTQEVIQTLSQVLERLRLLGIVDVIIDPGFGFGKTKEHNYTLLRELNFFKVFDAPILAGMSRKRMINEVLETTPETALNGTTAVNMLALHNGAHILRVHDVKEAVECIKIFKAYNPA